MPFRTNLRQLREEQGLSQSALAEKVGTTLNQYGKLERGERKLDESWLRRLAGALGVSVERIATDPSAPSDNGNAIPIPTLDALCSALDEHYRGVFKEGMPDEMLRDLSQRLLDSVENWREDPAASRDPQVARSVARQINRRFDH